jgi:hypothetical protein
LLVACPKKETPVVVDASPPPPPPDPDTGVTQLVPLEEDAGQPDADAGKPKWSGPGVNTNVARLKQCCNQLAITAKSMANSPEGAMLKSAADQCNAMAVQAGPTGTAPELGMLRGLLAGRTIPPACAGF